MRTVFATYLIQVAALCTLGILVGVVGGAGLTALGVWLFGDALPVPPRMGLYPAPLLLAVAYGLLVAAAFALWPLARAAQIPGAALFRDALLPGPMRGRGVVLAANAAVALALVGLLVAASPDRGFALWFCAAAAATLLLFRAGGAGLMALARRAPHVPPPGPGSASPTCTGPARRRRCCWSRSGWACPPSRPWR